MQKETCSEEKQNTKFALPVMAITEKEGKSQMPPGFPDSSLGI
jgi:hypothetical protein